MSNQSELSMTVASIVPVQHEQTVRSSWKGNSGARPWAAAVTMAKPTIVWAGIRYRKDHGRVVRLDAP